MSYVRSLKIESIRIVKTCLIQELCMVLEGQEDQEELSWLLQGRDTKVG